ncbi:MAG: aldo/keto reductase [Spirochaetia bacterium]|jgi:aryl-alcohol dehydrogenase-like predicted oxidoreductase
MRPADSFGTESDPKVPWHPRSLLPSVHRRPHLEGDQCEYAQIQPLLEALKRIADARGKTVPQVALNWILCRGALPIPGAKSPEQARLNAGAMGWRLTAAEVAELEAVEIQPRKKRP